MIHPPRLAGRGRELTELSAALGRPPALVLVEGEAGVGKSRLLQECLATPVGQRVRSMTVSTPPFREPYPLGPVVDALRTATERVSGLGLSGLAGALRPLFPEWAEDLPPAPEPLGTGRAERHRLLRALAELLASLEVGVLVVEDVHWADDATLEFLLFLAFHRPAPSLVLTYRPEDLPDDSLLLRLSSRPPAEFTRVRLVLDPLDVAGTGEMVSSMLGGEPVPEGFARFVHRRTGGLPLVVEAVRLMGERADLARRGGRWVRRPLTEIDVPPTVRDAVLERARQLSPDAQEVLRAVAVIGEECTEDVLAAVAALPPARCAGAVGQALGCGLLRETAVGGYAMRHALAAHALREATPAPQRRLLHLRAGRVLEGLSPPPLARLAHHFRAAGQTAEWFRYAERAVDQARESYDDQRAAQLLHGMVTATGVTAGTAARLTGRIPFGSYPEAWLEELAVTLRRLADDGTASMQDRGRVRFHLGRVLSMMERPEAATAELERAVAELPAGAAEAARAMLLLSWPRAADVPASTHLRWLARSAADEAAIPQGERLGMAVERATIQLELGRPEGWALADQLPATAAGPEERRCILRGLAHLGEAAILWGHYAQARRYVDAATAAAQRYRSVWIGNCAQVNGFHIDVRIGRWDGLSARAEALAAGGDLSPMTPRTLRLVTGLLHTATGAYDVAAPHLRFAMAESRRHSSLCDVVMSAAALGRALLLAGRLDEALSETDESVEIVLAKSTWLWATDLVPVRVDALLAAGRADEATDLVARFAAGLRGAAAPAPRPALGMCRAILAAHRGDHRRAVAGFANAARRWRELPRPYDALLAEERRAESLLAAGDLDAALRSLSTVLAGLSRLGATGCAARVALRLRGHGVDVGPVPDPRPRPGPAHPGAARRGRRGYGDQLSPRELEVVRLVATGRTNREIAEALVVSPKTVARHIDGAMRKLTVSSRTALAVRAIELGVATADTVAARR